jgi:pimeloyl-ACP methyl ester carboxylesterase
LPNPGEAHIRRAADKLEARWHVIETGHYPMLSTPDELTRIILNG